MLLSSLGIPYKKATLFFSGPPLLSVRLQAYANGSPPRSSRTLIRTTIMAQMFFTGSVLLSSVIVYNIFLLVGILPPFPAPVNPFFASFYAFYRFFYRQAAHCLQKSREMRILTIVRHPMDRR
jgi:hypothetical protein